MFLIIWMIVGIPICIICFFCPVKVSDDLIEQLGGRRKLWWIGLTMFLLGSAFIASERMYGMPGGFDIGLTLTGVSLYLFLLLMHRFNTE